MYCENCGHELRPNARFCTACGAPVSMPDPEREDVQLYTEQLDAAPTWQPAAPVYVRAEPQRPARSLHDVAHHVRAYLAMLFAVLSILLLFLPWVNAALEITVNGVSFGSAVTDLKFGSRSANNPVSILDLLRYQQATDLFPLELQDTRIAASMQAEGLSAEDRINAFVGVPASVSIKGLSVPTGLLAAAPQLLCVLLMLMCYLIGAIRVFAVEAFPDGAPRTGWLMAGGIIGVFMSVCTWLELYAINHFYGRILERVTAFNGDVYLRLRPLYGFVLFAVACFVLIVLSIHWGKRGAEETL